MSNPTVDVTSLSLLGRARTSDQQAWGQLVQLYGPLVHRWCKQSGLTDDDTADVFQETFRAVSANLDRYAPQKSVGSFRSWLRTIVRTKVADHFRRLGKQPQGRGGTEAQIDIAHVADPLDDDPLSDDTTEAAESEQALIVRRAMELIKPEFNPRNWKAFWQVAIEGQSAADVARDLGLDPQVIRQANYRIRRRLRLMLRDLVDDLADEA